jgi:hypothetical protein
MIFVAYRYGTELFIFQLYEMLIYAEDEQQIARSATSIPVS